MPAQVQQTVVVPLGRGQIHVPGVIHPGRRQQPGRLAKCVAGQGLARLRQQVGQGILAPFQRIGPLRRQGQDALEQRQRTVRRAIQAALLLRRHRAGQHGIQPRPLRLQLAQMHRNRCDLRLRHLQHIRQCQRALGGRCVTGGDGRTRLHHRGRPCPRQSGARLAAVTIQRQRGGIQFARTVAIGNAELATRQCRIATLQQLLDAAFRPQPVGQRLAQHHRAHHQAGARQHCHTPQRTIAQRRPEARRPGPARQRKHGVASILGAT
ncbi:hypothetical protein EBN15_13650 [Xanthomonas cucurbitae]|nr:hypothetical protein EBN15_13650 [Xanthomonas cucurbitae]